MITWHKIPADISPGITELRIAGKRICLVTRNDSVYACAAHCPHAGGDLASGYVDAMGNIVCPVHHYRFSLKSGYNASGEGFFLKTYPIEEREDGLYIGIT